MTNKKTLLVFDDEPDIVELMTLILSKDYNVVSHYEITDVYKQVKEANPDLILMDLSIPKEGGAAACRQLNSHEELKKIPVILFSANNDIGNVCEEVGAEDCITKPFQITELKSTIAKYID